MFRAIIYQLEINHLKNDIVKVLVLNNNKYYTLYTVHNVFAF